MAPKKTRLVWGIVLSALGLFGVFNLNNDILFVIVWIICILIGGLLIFLYVSALKKYNLLQKEKLNTSIERQKLESARHSVERSVLEMEETRIKEEMGRIRGESKAVRICPSCGAANRGEYCEYCGRKL